MLEPTAPSTGTNLRATLAWGAALNCGDERTPEGISLVLCIFAYWPQHRSAASFDKWCMRKIDYFFPENGTYWMIYNNKTRKLISTSPMLTLSPSFILLNQLQATDTEETAESLAYRSRMIALALNALIAIKGLLVWS